MVCCSFLLADAVIPCRSSLFSHGLFPAWPCKSPASSPHSSCGLRAKVDLTECSQETTDDNIACCFLDYAPTTEQTFPMAATASL
ncbi:hypothetical protein PISMIDRAFT_196443 [Pisolithus microcarpus 441]|uniref:Uncharacterized protein n=1 Tax=Pisolithus microcarpus 441 TaxID=765257 RepID=A0A0C9YN60_9AGAM|nr:hypothetical protein PISMIDRAFT_196443 [Pisolithus microcarpus 441]